MKRFIRLAPALFAAALLTLATTGHAQTAAPRADVVRANDLQARIDQKVDGEAAQRETIRALLRRADVKKIAGAAGLSVERASLAVGQLSGPELASVAARADVVNATTGGRKTVTIEVTTIIIVLLLILLIAH